MSHAVLFFTSVLSEISIILRRLGHVIDDEVAFLRLNYDYYLPRTSHGSTLSYTVMAKIAHLCGRPTFEWNWFMEAARSDIFDRQVCPFSVIRHRYFTLVTIFIDS